MLHARKGAHQSRLACHGSLHHHRRRRLHGYRQVSRPCQHPGQARSQEEEELLWKDLFSKPSCWVDYRRRKRTLLHPDFRHKETKAPLWLNSMLKPHWVDLRLAVSGPGSPPEETAVHEFCDKGDLGMAMDALSRMDYDGFTPSDALYITILKACQKCKALSHVMAISSRIFRYEEGLLERLKDVLIITLAKCGGLIHARNLLHTLPDCSLDSWTTVIDGFVECGRNKDALTLFAQMQEFPEQPDHNLYASLLRACTNLGNLDEGLFLHAAGEMMGFFWRPEIGEAILNMYSKFESILEAEGVFYTLLQQDVLSWNVMLSVYLKNGLWDKVLLAYRQIQEEKWSADAATFTIALQACSSLSEQESLLYEEQSKNEIFLEIGRALHAVTRGNRFSTDITISSSLIMMYGKCGSIHEAWNVFEGSSKQDIYLWNAMVSAHVQQGQGAEALFAYVKLHACGLVPNIHILVASLRACIILMENDEATATAILKVGEALHSDARTHGFASNGLIENTILSLYGKCGHIALAETVFLGLVERDVVSWNAMLSIYIHHGQPAKAFLLYRQMVVECGSADMLAYVFCIQACGILTEQEKLISKCSNERNLASIQVGRSLHADIKKSGHSSNTFICNALISMYGKCACLTEAENVFYTSVAVDVITWNAMLSVYVDNGEEDSALRLFSKMLEVGECPNKLTYVIALQACIAVAEKEEPLRKEVASSIGHSLHIDILSEGLLLDDVMYSALISLYGKCGAGADAESIFRKVLLPSMVAWNAMLSSYVEQSLNVEALHLLNQMEGNDVPIDDITLVCALQVCSHLGSIEICRQLSFKVFSTGFECIPNIINTLIHSFGQCSGVADAEAAFFQMSQPFQVSWNAWIASSAMTGMFEGSCMVFQSMQLAGIIPDSSTYLSLISTCSHIGHVENSFLALQSMSRDFYLSPDIKHYSALVDVLGRAGNFTKVKHLLAAIPIEANLPLWLSLLGACRIHGNIEFAREAFKQAMDMQPNYCGSYVLLSNTLMIDVFNEQSELE